ncbi:unnamed protein product, partial [Symbiodinium microadriaticum]
PYRPGDWVLYWLRKTSPNRLAAGRWHGPAKVICQAPGHPNPEPELSGVDVPVPESDEGLSVEEVHLASTPLEPEKDDKDALMSFLTLHAAAESVGPPVAEDNLPYVVQPLSCAEQQAFCLEVPVNAKTYRRWAKEKSPDQMITLASVSKRARAEVFVKDLTATERGLFEAAKQKEIQCWLQTSAIRKVVAQKLGRALVLQTIASAQFPLSSFDIKTAFLRGKADAANPLAMEPPPD